MSHPRTSSNTGLTIAAVALVALVAIMGIYLVMGWNRYPLGQPQKNPLTNTYTIYAVVLGHRDSTFLHWNAHANIQIDVAILTAVPPSSLPDGAGWFAKSITVTCIISGGSQPISVTFAMSVGTGSQWGYASTISLLSGGYTITCNGIDQDGFISSASGGISLP